LRVVSVGGNLKLLNRLHAFANKTFEPFPFGDEPVVSRSEERHEVVAGVIALLCDGDVRGEIGGVDDDSGYWSALGPDFLGVRGARKQRRQKHVGE
jgi:hypothetical protein